MPDPVVNQPNQPTAQEDQLASLADALNKLRPYLENQPAQGEQPAAAPAPVAQPAQAPQPAAAEQLSVTLPSGHVLTAATPQELTRQVEAYLYHAERDRQAMALRGQQPAAEPQPVVDKWKAPTMAEKEEYAKKFLENPYEATVHALKEITGWEDPIAVLKQTVQGVHEQQEALAVQQFLVRNPDYVPSQQNLAAVNHIMQQAGWNSSLINLEAAWEHAKKNGWAVTNKPAQAPPQAPAAQPQPQPQPQQPGMPFQHALANTPAPPPAIPRGGGAAADEASVLAQFENLSVDQMREVLLRTYGQK